jgi:serine/threonine protein kinase
LIAKFGTFEYALAERYRFDAELGRGAMGTVYRARDVRLDRAVAIKMLHATLTNELGVARFQSEIRIAASLHHPNIVSVHDSGEADGRLFYVMDYLGGETLRTRIHREKQLSVDDALVIVEQIANGLQFAHDRGVVHRDIKPENILLTDGIARVVDFGLARALGDVDTERLTASGLSVGTPQYLSPEQAAAEKDVGPRADQYGLACVLYEMLAGEPPFTGPTATAVAMRHISEVPASLGKRRRTTPPSVDVSVMRALEKVPADRFGSVKEFANALRAPVPIASGSLVVPAQSRKKRLALPYVVVLGVLCIAIVGMIGAAVVRFDDPIDDGFRWLTNRPLDTNRYAVLPFTSPASVAADGLDGRLRDALTAWTGVSAPGASELRSALNGKTASELSAGDGRMVARAVGAGRYVMGSVTTDGTVLRIRAEAMDASGRANATTASMTVAVGATPPDSVIAHFVYQLLFSGDEARRNESAARGTESRAAFALYLRGKRATRTWSLVDADSAFTVSLRTDQSFPQALLALAEVRSWERDRAPDISGLVQRATDGAVKLTTAERTHAHALAELVTGHFHEACVGFESLLAVDSTDFAAWYGVGQCNLADRAVVPDRASPSGKIFRASRYRSSVGFRRAFDLLPTIDSCCIQRATTVLQRPLIVTSIAPVTGIGLSPDTTRYAAYPELLGDTIALFPRPYGEMMRAPPITHTLAVDRMREMYFAIAAKRLAMFPHSAVALEALGEALELRSDASAVDTVHKARLAATTLSDTVVYGTLEIWLRLKYALPSNVRELGAIRALAESLLVNSSRATAADASELASLAALIGDADAASQLSMKTAEAGPGLPPTGVGAIGKAYLTLASMGRSADSLQAVESRLVNAIANQVVQPDQAPFRNMLIGQAAALAYPVYRSAYFSELNTAADYLLAAEAAHARGDRVLVRKILSGAAQSRVNMRAADVTLDTVYPEAWLLASIGDSTAALRLLSSTLDGISGVLARQFEAPAIAGSLIQSMTLLAQLERAKNPRLATIWATAVLSLSDVDTPDGKARQRGLANIVRR